MLLLILEYRTADEIPESTYEWGISSLERFIPPFWRVGEEGNIHTATACDPKKRNTLSQNHWPRTITYKFQPLPKAKVHFPIPFGIFICSTFFISIFFWFGFGFFIHTSFIRFFV